MDTEIDLKSILGLVRRQVWLILTTIVLVVVATLIATYAITPRYTADSLILVDTSFKDLLDTENQLSNPGADNAKVESEVGILRSDRVLVDVVREHNLVIDDEFGIKLSLKDRLFSLLRIPLPPAPTGDEALGNVLNAFRSAVSINRSGLTYLISVGVVSKDPAKAAKLANAVGDAYIRQQIASKVASTLVARNTIQNRVAAANTTIVENEKKFDVYITENIDRIEKDTNSPNLGNLRTELDRLQAEQLREARRVESLQRSMADENFAAVTADLGSQALEQLRQQREALATRVADNANSPQAVELRAELAKIDNSLRSSASAEINNIQKSVTNFQDQANSVRQQLRTTVVQSNLPPEILAEIYSLQQSSEIARNQYQNLLAKLQELDAQSDLQLPDSRVVSAALTPTTPSFPNKPLILGVALVFSLGMGIGLAILREYFVGGFINESQVEGVLKMPLTAILPKQANVDERSRNNSGSTTVADLMIEAPLSLYSEAIRRLRLSIDHERWSKGKNSDSDTREGTIVMVTSAVPSEGKSTVALSLARAYALSGQQTLLIDCDLRKPSIYRHLGLEPNDDFLHYLRQERNTVALSTLTKKDPMSNLSVLLNGRRSDIPTDSLVMSEKMGRVLAIARKHFDYVIIDTPPIEPVVDGLYLSRYVDVIVYVIRWAHTSQSSIRRAVNALRSNKNPDAGLVTIINQQERTRSSAYGNYYVE